MEISWNFVSPKKSEPCVCSQKKSIKIYIELSVSCNYKKKKNHEIIIFCFSSHLEHPSGCSDGTSDGLAGYEEIQACKGKWIGHVKRGM